MKIDYMKNPLAVVKKFLIHYGEPAENLRLEGRVIARTEEGIDSVNWFSGEVVYDLPTRIRGGMSEIGGHDDVYRVLSRGGPSVRDVETKLRFWCGGMGLKVSKQFRVRVGVTGYRFSKGML